MPGKIEKVCESPHESDLTAIAYCEATGLLYTSGGDSKVKVWDKDLNLKNEILAHDGWIYCIAVSDQGKVYTGSNDGTVRVLANPLTDTVAQKLVESREEILSIACDGNRTYSGDDKGVIICLENDKFTSRIETSEACNCIFVEGDLLYSIRDRDLAINTILARKLVANIANRACIPGRHPIAVFGPVEAEHRRYIALMERGGKGFQVHTCNAGKSFSLLAEVLDAHEMIIFSACGYETTLYTGDYAGKVKRWKIDEESKKVNLIDEVEVCPGVCINGLVAADSNTLYVGSNDCLLKKICYQ